MQDPIKFPAQASGKPKKGVVKIKPKKLWNIAQSKRFERPRMRARDEDSDPGVDRWPFCGA